jgi:hypothetical protein
LIEEGKPAPNYELTSDSGEMVSLAGLRGKLIAEVEVPDLATFERESDAQSSDAEWLKVVRSTVDFFVQGTGNNELLQMAPRLA